ncbi:MAG: bifunctional metallophosphatase/5'-nucleotidase [Salinivirgaceae bacterium]|nr:bifunctional metallophosphatase/5'-nucleotidase [Salinivirgaceae bacterium]
MMIKPTRLFVLILLAGLTFSGCTPKKPESAELYIYQTTDVHGTFFPFNYVEGRPSGNSLAHVYSFVQSERQTHGNDAVILLDNGDLLQGQPTVYYYNYEDTTSAHIAADVLNFMDYDAASVGNHDIETGHAGYDRFRKQLKCPYLAANAVNTSTGEPYFEPYTIIERKGIKIAVLGLITPGIPKWLPENLWSGMRFDDMVETAKKWVPIILEKEKPDLLVGLFHSGVDYNYENADGTVFMNENATKLVAQQVPGFDLVLAGHDHKFYNEKVVNIQGDTVLLLDPRSHARAVAAISIKFKQNHSKGTYEKLIDAKVVEMNDRPIDSLFMATFQSSSNTILNYVSRQIGEFTEAVDSKDAYFGNSAFIDLIQNVQMEVSKADVSFCSPLSYRTQVEKGPVVVGDLFKLYKYENLLYTLSLTGGEIDKYLEYSYALWFNQMSSFNDHLLKLETDTTGQVRFKNKYYNFSSASGIDYLVDVSKPDGDKIKILGFSNGQAFYADSTYLVAVNSYQGNGGGGHLTVGVGLSDKELNQRIVKVSEYDLRYYVMKWIESHPSIKPVKASNWRVIPEDYYEFGKRRDMKLLFESNASAHQE